VSFPNSQAVTVSEAVIDPVTNQLTIKLAYSQDLQDSNLTMQMNAPNSAQAFAFPNMSSSWVVQPSNNLKAVAYSDWTYSASAGLSILSNLLIGFYLSMLLLTIAYRKFIGLELATLVQLGYLSLLENREITAYQYPIVNWSYAFGYNEYWFSPLTTATIDLPYRIYGYEAYFGYSNNVMVIVTLICYVIAGLLFILSLITARSTAWRLKSAAFATANDLCYTLVVFSSPNILTAIYIEIKEGVILDWSLPWSKCFLIVSIFMIIFAHFLNVKTAEKNSDVGTFLQKRRNGAVYMPIIFNIRLLAITTLLFLYHVTSAIPAYLALILQLAYTLFVIFGRPHLLAYDFYRSLCLEVGLMVIFLTRIVDVSTLADSIDPHSVWYPLVAYLEYVIYILGIIVTEVSFIYHLFRAFRSSSKVKNHEGSKKHPQKPEIANETLQDLN
jgi:hypothetical protein